MTILELLNFLMTMAALGASFSTFIQMCACRRPFRNEFERWLGLFAASIWFCASFVTLYGITIGVFQASVVTLLNWIAATILISFVWMLLGRMEKLVKDVEQKSSVFKGFRKMPGRISSLNTGKNTNVNSEEKDETPLAS